MKFKLCALSALMLASHSASASQPSNQELLDLIQQQQAQIEKLAKELEKTDKKVETTASSFESAMTSAKTSQSHFGGYGELHYGKMEDSKKIDFHRYVMYFSHDFSDKVRFFSELELEHSFAAEGAPGEVELEQAYIEMNLGDSTAMKAGLFLVPVGIINETHEPPTFYGVERNPVEKNIIPATWWEAGTSFNFQFSPGLSADFALHSGLNVPTSSYKIRSGRQKVAEANADSLAYTTRIKYTAVPGLELAASYQYQSDLTQGAHDADASLITVHAVYQVQGFALKALYAAWDISGDEAAVLGRDEQNGYYLEPGYRFNPQWGIFARYSAWDNTAGDNLDSKMKQTNLGVNFWPHEQVVFKFDLENRSGDQDGNGFNLGVGYHF